jgi:hypothetical protein
METTTWKNKFKDELWSDLSISEKVDIIIMRIIWGIIGLILMACSAAIVIFCIVLFLKLLNWVIK